MTEELDDGVTASRLCRHRVFQMRHPISLKLPVEGDTGDTQRSRESVELGLEILVVEKSWVELATALSIYNLSHPMSPILLRCLMNIVPEVEDMELVHHFVSIIRIQSMLRSANSKSRYVKALKGDLPDIVYLPRSRVFLNTFSDFVANLVDLIKTGVIAYVGGQNEGEINGKVLNGFDSETGMSPEDRLERGFLVFQALADFFEQDLWNWRENNPSGHLSSTNCPIIASIAWNDDDCGRLNQLCRNAFSILCHLPDSPGVALFVSLLAEICYLKEKTIGKSFNELSHDFASELATCIKGLYPDAPYLVINQLTSDWLKLLVCAHILDWRSISKSLTLSSSDILKIVVRNLTNKPQYFGHPDVNRRSMGFFLHAFVKRNEMSSLKRLLEDPAVDVNQQDGGVTALYLAVTQNNLDCIRILIEMRLTALIEGSEPLDVNAESNKGTPLMKAIKQGNEDIVRLLLSHGAATSIYTKNPREVSALFSSPPRIRELLIDEYTKAMDTYKRLDLSPNLVQCLFQMIKSYLHVSHWLSGNSTGESQRTVAHDYETILRIFERLSSSDQTMKQYCVTLRRILHS